ncbi:hypothetical protein Neosp_009644 [[Neocosmospora] mangrovei]
MLTLETRPVRLAEGFAGVRPKLDIAITKPRRDNYVFVYSDKHTKHYEKWGYKVPTDRKFKKQFKKALSKKSSKNKPSKRKSSKKKSSTKKSSKKNSSKKKTAEQEADDRVYLSEG